MSLDYRSGHLFEHSKDPKEGFEQHTNTKGAVSYRRYHPYGVEGVLNSVSVRDGSFGKELSLALDGGTYINFGLYDQKGSVDQNAEEVIKILPMLNKGQNIKIAPFRFKPQDSKYDKSGITFYIEGEKTKGLSNSYYKEGELIAGDVPAVKWNIDKMSPDKKKPSLADVEVKNDYLLDVLSKEAERLKWVGSGQQAPQAEARKPQDESSTLPF